MSQHGWIDEYSTGGGYDAGGPQRADPLQSELSLVVWPCPDNVEEDELFDIFSAFGPVNDVHFSTVMDKHVVIVEFDSAEGLSAAYALNGKMLLGNTASVWPSVHRSGAPLPPEEMRESKQESGDSHSKDPHEEVDASLTDEQRMRMEFKQAVASVVSKVMSKLCHKLLKTDAGRKIFRKHCRDICKKIQKAEKRSKLPLSSTKVEKMQSFTEKCVKKCWPAMKEELQKGV